MNANTQSNPKLDKYQSKLKSSVNAQMKISASISPEEHWLTLMNCVKCKRTPEASPLYKCHFGHTVCYACFQDLVAEEEIPVCNQCGSEKFTRHDVSDDFLRKLKFKPGIGRPYRYKLKPPAPSRSEPPPDSLVTVEQLFQLPTEKIQQLFVECTKEKLAFLKKLSATECLRGKLTSMSHSGRVDGGRHHKPHRGAREEAILKEKLCETSPSQSRKPLKCPHDMCNKIVAISSFRAHFQHEHFDFKRYRVARGGELCLPFDPSLIQHGKSVCLAMVSLVPRDADRVRSTITCDDDGADQTEIDCFWLMASGSHADNHSQAYSLLWLFTNNEEQEYNCTMELTSEQNVMTMTTFCKVNKVHESQSAQEVAMRENCLYLAYSTMKSMLVYGPDLLFQMIIH